MTKDEHDKIMSENPIKKPAKYMGLLWEIASIEPYAFNGEYYFKVYLQQPKGDYAARGSEITIETFADYNTMVSH